MRKKEEKGIAAILIIVAVVYPFVWIYKQMGPVGFGLLIVVLIGIMIYWKIQSGNKDQKSFDDLVLYILHNRMHPDEARELNKTLYKNNFARAALIRNLQIIRDSIEISLSSKKRDVAESRAKSILDLNHEIQTDQAYLVSDNVRKEIGRVCTEAINEFNTRLFLNIAEGHIEKVQALKTDKSKIKYLNMASEILEEGIRIGRGDVATLKSVLKNVHDQRARFI